MKRLGIVVIAAILIAMVGAVPAAAAGTCGSTYTVVRGDTLARIATRCGTTVSAIMAANPGLKDPSHIYPGQVLQLSGGTTPPGSTVYTVRRGDTLAIIAARFHTTVAAILWANPSIKNPNYLSVGQKIVIPGSTGAVFTSVKVALIALESGNIGCNDAVQLVTRNIPATSEPLTAAIRELLSIKQQHYGQSGLYDALYASNLAISSVTLSNGKATIRLTGSLSLGGECDDPRAKAQIEQTALQFSTVQQVEVFINGTPLDDLLGGKGM